MAGSELIRREALVLGSTLGGASGEGTVTKARLPSGMEVAYKEYNAEALRQHATRTEAKLTAMVRNQPAEAVEASGHRTMLWPTHLVHCRGRFTGFCMPLLPTGMLEMEAVVDHRARNESGLKDWNWGVMVGLARNLSLAVDALHRNGVRWGDLNQHNIAVNLDGRVSLFDLDTAEFRVGSTVHRGSGFTREEWRPPEYWGRTETRFTEEGDRWALAVQIHILLMESFRPWVTTSSSQTVEQCVLAQAFPVLRADLPIPPARPSIAVLTPRILELMRRTFGPGFSRPELRPSAKEYARALAELHQSRFQRCARNSHHVFAAHCPACPWCERLARASAARKQQSGPANRSAPTRTPARPTGPTLPRPRPVAAATNRSPTAARVAGVGRPRPTVAPPPVRRAGSGRTILGLSTAGLFVVLLIVAGAAVSQGRLPSPSTDTNPTGRTSPPISAATQLARITMQDADQVESKLLGTWVPQLASATIGSDASTGAHSAAWILKRHRRLTKQYDAVLLNSSDYVFRSPNYWVSLAPVSYSTADAALSWCRRHDLNADNCFAKLITHDPSARPNVKH